MDNTFESMTHKDKRQARIIALQALYAFEIAETDLSITIKTIVDEIKVTISSDVIDYGYMLCKMTVDSILELDKLISERLNNWEIKRVSLIDKLILRLEIMEMLLIETVPPKVSIVEGVEIAKLFGTMDSSKFVNGILDSVYNDLLKGSIKFNKA